MSKKIKNTSNSKLNKNQENFYIQKEVSIIIEEYADTDTKVFPNLLNENFNDLGLGSLDIVEVCIKTEEKFKINMDDDEFIAVNTTSELISLVQKTLELKSLDRLIEALDDKDNVQKINTLNKYTQSRGSR